MQSKASVNELTVFRHCTYSNASAFQVNLHEKRKHVDRTIPCKLCDRKFSTTALLRIHVQTSHQKVSSRVHWFIVVESLRNLVQPDVIKWLIYFCLLHWHQSIYVIGGS